MEDHNTSLFQVFVGVWKGQGIGYFPGIPTFEYTEELVFEPISSTKKPVSFYRQKTWHKEKKLPMHGESGYMRFLPDCSMIELPLVQSTGIVTIEKGTLSSSSSLSCSNQIVTMELSSNEYLRSPFAKEPHVKSYSRKWWIHLNEPNKLYYTISIETQEKPLQPHLEACFEKSL